MDMWSLQNLASPLPGLNLRSPSTWSREGRRGRGDQLGERERERGRGQGEKEGEGVREWSEGGERETWGG